MNFLRRVYSFDANIDFKKGWRIALVVSLLFCLCSFVFLGVRQLNLGLDFRGGVSWQFPKNGKSTDDISAALASAGQHDTQVQTLGNRDVRVEVPPVTTAERNKIARALAQETDNSVATVNANLNEVGPSWGHDVSSKALKALIIFLIVIFLYITIRLEWKYAVGAIVAVIHDIIISVGVYAVFQFQVTPGTVIAFLTILGYSLYDTIVVYDKLKENQPAVTPNGGMTFTDMANKSVNQTFMRSINTTLSAVLPVLAILLIGAWIYGAVTLEEFGLALLVGLISGAYSSVFVAAPVTAWLKEREPKYKAIRARVEAQRERGELPDEAAAVPAGARAATTAVGEREEEPEELEAAAAAAGKEKAAVGATRSGARGDARSSRTPPTPRATNAKYSSAHPPRPRKKTPDRRRKK